MRQSRRELRLLAMPRNWQSTGTLLSEAGWVDYAPPLSPIMRHDFSGLARGPQPASAVRGFRAWCASRLVSPKLIENNDVGAPVAVISVSFPGLRSGDRRRRAASHASNKVKVGVLKFGTVSWLLDTIHANGLDKAEGIELDIMPLASTQATTVGLQGGSVDIIATDWLWVSRERSRRRRLHLLALHHRARRHHGAAQLADQDARPTSRASGSALPAAHSTRAGSCSWPMRSGPPISICRTETKQEFGAPPLLAERAKQGELDAVLNFWPYAARLEADGFTQLIGVEDVVQRARRQGRGRHGRLSYSARAGPRKIPAAMRASCARPPKPTTCWRPPTKNGNG